MKRKAGRLRRQILFPLAAAFLALWLGAMLLLTQSSRRELEGEITVSYRNQREEMEEQYEIYLKNLANGVGDWAEHILVHNLTGTTLNMIDKDGGMAAMIRVSMDKVYRTQLAYGLANTVGANVGQDWFLYLDEGLDDAGQMALARWIMEHRDSWDYSIYPADNKYAPGDGTIARVTGQELPGYGIQVSGIQLIHPDGTAETVVETTYLPEQEQTWDFAWLKLSSVLLPGYWSSGRDDYSNMKRRLANFREAQAILDRELAGEKRSVVTANAAMGGTYEGDGIGLRYVAYQCDPMPTVLRENRGLYISTLILMVLVLLWLSGRLSRRITGPMEELCAAVERGEQCREDGDIQELNTLSAAFNADRAKLEDQLRREREFTRAAAHELKTPLAVLRSHAEALREDIAPEKREAYLDVVLDESDRMSALVGQLLDLYRMQAGVEEDREAVELSSLISEMVRRMERTAAEKQLSLELSLERTEVWGNRVRLEQAAANLLSNALRHGTAGGRVAVTLKRTKDLAVLTVYNDGPSIPEADMPHLWEPFFRSDRSRSRESGGTGLGLTLVRTVVLEHGGDCTGENVSGGVQFRVKLPVLQSEH